MSRDLYVYTFVQTFCSYSFTSSWDLFRTNKVPIVLTEVPVKKYLGPCKLGLGPSTNVYGCFNYSVYPYRVLLPFVSVSFSLVLLLNNPKIRRLVLQCLSPVETSRDPIPF